ncbi:MAG: methionine--tRNA ligase [Clostridia bacterium]|nr:methionine--tRNA ligase [Clostridia bacterium]
MSKPKFYITTAIAYASRKPHIGNAYDPVLADSIARYKRMRGFDVYFLTGSDEHGQKIQAAAEESKITPKEYVDSISDEIKAVWNSLNLTYDRFIRTTDEDHEASVKKIFEKLFEQGDIYKSEYEGKYCVPCESFFTASQLVDGKCPDCGREVVDAKEEAYFLRLSKYQDRLLEYYEQNPDFFQPESRKNEMINNFLKPGLNDLCVTRSTFSWGVKVPFDPKHVIYVWIDALSNYITGIGYNPTGSKESFKKYWPADVHVIGKDIVRFHTIYWPILLMALDLPLPKQVLGHPWLLFGEEKMSKSKGNVLYADEMVKKFGTDAVRYYMLSEIPFAQDGNITYESFMELYNIDLANNLGNLVNRSISMARKYFDTPITCHSDTDIDKDLENTIQQTIEKYTVAMDSYHTADAADAIMELSRRCNKYIDETTPWLLAKSEEDKSRLEAVMYHLLDSIRVLAILLKPFTPDTSEAIFKQLQIEDSFTKWDSLSFGKVASYTVGTPEPLFARLDTESIMKEVMEERAKAAEAKPEGVSFLEEISIDEFAKVDLRVAKIEDCVPVKKSKKLLQLTLNDGSGKQRTVCSGISPWYSPEDLIGKSIILVANLKPATLCGVESQGMILAADAGENDVKVVFVDGIEPGSKVR